MFWLINEIKLIVLSCSTLRYRRLYIEVVLVCSGCIVSFGTVLVLKYTWFVPCTKVLVLSVYLGSTGNFNTPSQNTRTTGWFSVRNEEFAAWVLVRENAVNYFRVGRMGAFFDGGWNHGVCWGNRLRFRLRGSKLY